MRKYENDATEEFNHVVFKTWGSSMHPNIAHVYGFIHVCISINDTV